MKAAEREQESWQSQKSALTRDRILVATLECIVRYGYENTTMQKIAKTSKVSQGALQYHFGSKIDAIKEAINYLHSKRLTDHQRALEEVDEGTDPMSHVIDFYWQQLNEAHFVAYQDLVIAARTHPELASVLRPAYQKFVKQWRSNAVAIIPEWATNERFEVAADLAQYLMEGLAYGRLNAQINDRRTKQVLALTRKLVLDLLTGK